LIGWPWLSAAYHEVQDLAAFTAMHPELSANLERQTSAFASLIDFFRLPGLHPLVRVLSPEGGGVPPDAPGGWNEISGLYLSLTLIPLLCIGIWRRPELRSWLWIALVLLVVVWDPRVGPGDGSGALGILRGLFGLESLPAEAHLSHFYRVLPGLETLRVPARFFPYFLLPIVILSAKGLDRLASYSGRVASLLIALVAIENWVGEYPLMPVSTPGAVTELAGIDDGGGVLTLPVRFGASEAMSWQAVHQHPVVFSYIARANPKSAYNWLQTNSDLFSLAVPRVDRQGQLVVPSPEGLGLDLTHLGVEHILVDSSASDLTGALLEVLGQLLDDLPGWERQQTRDRLWWWRRVA
jgi:hypothetical protein